MIGNAAVSRLVAARGQRTPAVRIARLVDPDSPSYLRGYNEGIGSGEANPGPLDGDALDSYNEGYRRGAAEAKSTKTSQPPVDKPAPVTPQAIEWDNPYLETIYEANKPGRPDQLAALKTLDGPPRTGVWAQLTWGKLVKSAGERIYNPNMMAQGTLGTCGPATVLNFLGTNDPGAYAALVISVFVSGKAKGYAVNSKLRGAAPQGGMDPLDWMMMSAIQDVQNDWYDFHGTAEGVESKREGTGSSDQRWMYKKIAGAAEAETIDTPKSKDVLPAARRVNGVVSNPGVAVNMHLSAAVLQNAASAENKRNHVIRLLKPIAITEDADDSKSRVEFEAFTWGQVYPWKGTVGQFQHMMWAFTIASMKKGVI